MPHFSLGFFMNRVSLCSDLSSRLGERTVLANLKPSRPFKAGPVQQNRRCCVGLWSMSMISIAVVSAEISLSVIGLPVWVGLRCPPVHRAESGVVLLLMPHYLRLCLSHTHLTHSSIQLVEWIPKEWIPDLLPDWESGSMTLGTGSLPLQTLNH